MSRTTSLQTILAALAVAATLGSPAFASAAIPLATGPVDYQIWMEPQAGEAIVLVSVQLPQTVKLPARVRIPVPPGMKVAWAGEISGGDVATDIKRPFTIHQGEGGEYAEVVLEMYRRGQIDATGREFDSARAAVNEQFELVQSVLTGEAGFSVKVPKGALAVGVDPEPTGPPELNARGQAVFTLGSRPLKPGERVLVSVAYRAAVTDGKTPPQSRPPRILFAVVGGTALVVGAVLAGVLLQGRRRGANRRAG